MIKDVFNLRKKCFIKLSKSLVSTRKISLGEIITRDMLTTKGPGSGISPMDINRIIGLTAARDIDEDIVLYREYFN